MRSWLVVALVGCGPSSDGTGLLVVATDTGIEAIDVATGDTTLLEPERWGGIAIAPDRQRVAYIGDDFAPRINDLHGTVQVLPSSEGYGTYLRWQPGGHLTYPLMTTPATELITAAGVARQLPTREVAVSHDGRRIAYVDAGGTLAIEDLDGGNRSAIADHVAVTMLAFDPDDAGLTMAVFDVDNTTHVEHWDGARHALGAGSPAPTIPGGSRYSPDGSELLVVEPSGNLIGRALADGAAHPYLGDGSANTAAYVEDGRVVAAGAVRGLPPMPSIAITDGSATTRLGSTSESQCFLSQLSIPNQQIALTCSVPAIVGFTGQTVLGHDALASLGLSADGAGLVTIGVDGTIELATVHGEVRTLATSVVPMGGTRVTPVAAYAP